LSLSFSPSSSSLIEISREGSTAALLAPISMSARFSPSNLTTVPVTISSILKPYSVSASTDAKSSYVKSTLSSSTSL